MDLAVYSYKRSSKPEIVGAKEKMRVSLRQDLVNEGEDFETYLFEKETVEEGEEVCFGAEAMLVVKTTTNSRDKSMYTKLSKTDESMYTMLGKTDEQIYDLLNKTDELMATMSIRISDPLLIGDPDNSDSPDKKPDDYCEYHNDRHRPDYVHVIPAAYTQAFYDLF
ncbi:hypothetical protein Bpfe_011893 [Biomphalaria pfeifferi]|uniref:Uncharacterized protein n=1 Tax=Biomphalaria pfeifferi TaxID=112525 RepID=A0AAD8BQ22_BIOPF|nr:hypothetical protein Bpfe_011893 [Biomphalaria pfeifferi]